MPLPSAFLSCIASKFSGDWAPETNVTAGAIPHTLIFRGASTRALSSASPASAILLSVYVKKSGLGKASFASATFTINPPRPSGTARDRKSVVTGKSVTVRVDLGGRRIIKKKLIYNDQHRN